MIMAKGIKKGPEHRPGPLEKVRKARTLVAADRLGLSVCKFAVRKFVKWLVGVLGKIGVHAANF